MKVSEPARLRRLAQSEARRAMGLIFIGQIKAAEVAWLEARCIGIEALISQVYENGRRSARKAGK